MEMLLSIFKMLIKWIEGMVLAFTPSKFLEKDVSGQVVLITGGASGIGRIMAEKFAERGARIVIWDVNESGLKETKDHLNQRHGKQVCSSFVCDISDRETVYRTAEEVRAQIGCIDILVNNAGIVNGKRLLQLDDSKIVKLLEINTLSHFWTVKAFLPDMISRRRGHIVSIASIAGLSGGCNMTDYCASKFANIGFMEALMYELKSDGFDDIYTTSVCPWYISTGLFAGVEAGIIPFLQPEYVADSVVSAVLRNQEVLFIPRLLYFMYVLKAMLPVRAMVQLFRALNGHRQMDTFVGREGSISSSKNLNDNQPQEHQQPQDNNNCHARRVETLRAL